MGIGRPLSGAAAVLATGEVVLALAPAAGAGIADLFGDLADSAFGKNLRPRAEGTRAFTREEACWNAYWSGART